MSLLLIIHIKVTVAVGFSDCKILLMFLEYIQNFKFTRIVI